MSVGKYGWAVWLFGPFITCWVYKHADCYPCWR